MHETHGKLESRQNIPIALFLAARVLLQVVEGLDLHLLKQAIHGQVRRAEHIVEVAILLAGALHHSTREEILGNAFRGKMGSKSGKRSTLHLPGGQGSHPIQCRYILFGTNKFCRAVYLRCLLFPV